MGHLNAESASLDETICHVISSCQALSVERERIMIEFNQLCNRTRNQIMFDDILKNEETLCQFIIDPTSLNLKSRVSTSDPLVMMFYKLSRDFCYIIDKKRIGLLKEMEDNLKWWLFLIKTKKTMQFLLSFYFVSAITLIG